MRRRRCPGGRVQSTRAPLRWRPRRTLRAFAGPLWPPPSVPQAGGWLVSAQHEAPRPSCSFPVPPSRWPVSPWSPDAATGPERLEPAGAPARPGATGQRPRGSPALASPRSAPRMCPPPEMAPTGQLGERPGTPSAGVMSARANCRSARAQEARLCADTLAHRKDPPGSCGRRLRGTVPLKGGH